jgi:FAD/FMN-containing dehydrogenase
VRGVCGARRRLTRRAPAVFNVAVPEGTERLSRRRFIAVGAALASGAQGVKLQAPASAAAEVSSAPPGFPRGVAASRRRFMNWAQAIEVEGVWTCAPRTPEDVVAVVNWAWRHRYRVRALGRAHTWSPLALARTPSRSPRVVLVDTTRHLTGMRLAGAGPAAVVTQAGATMQEVLAFLEGRGLGLTAHPAPGDLTVGGVLAIDGHGTAIPAHGEHVRRGQGFGSVSNMVLSVTAVVWSERRRRYVLRSFGRDDPACAALLTHLGRMFVTSVTLRAGPLQHLRCVSRTDVPADELFAAPGAPGRTFASFLEASGRVEAIWYPFTDAPWLKVWTVSPERPATSRPVQAPYNYPFSDTLAEAEQREIRGRILSDPSEAVALGQESYAETVAALGAESSGDIWGAAKDVLLYVRPATLRVTANGYAILTRRRDVQRVISEFVGRYQAVVARYRAQGMYPLNMPLEIRVTGLDDPRDVGVQGAQPALLSALAPRADHPQWDVAVWLDILSFPGTPAADHAYRDIERWVFANYRPPYATVRPEWSKGWAYTERGAWTNRKIIERTVPHAFRAARTADRTWDAAVRTLDRLDPHAVFTSPLLRSLLRTRPR